ncbi:DNA-binding MarR family transcriptional regulator [Paraburkholderia sp. GAS334]
MKHYTTQNFLLNETIGSLLKKARNLVMAEMDAALQEFDITSQQMGILLSMHNDGASTPFELSTLLAVDTGLMTRLLDKLDARGLLKRSR